MNLALPIRANPIKIEKRNIKKNPQVVTDEKSTFNSAGTVELVKSMPIMVKNPPAKRFNPLTKTSDGVSPRATSHQQPKAGVRKAEAYIRPWNASTGQGQNPVNSSGRINNPKPYPANMIAEINNAERQATGIWEDGGIVSLRYRYKCKAELTGKKM